MMFATSSLGKSSAPSTGQRFISLRGRLGENKLGAACGLQQCTVPQAAKRAVKCRQASRQARARQRHKSANKLDEQSKASVPVELALAMAGGHGSRQLIRSHKPVSIGVGLFVQASKQAGKHTSE